MIRSATKSRSMLDLAVKDQEAPDARYGYIPRPRPKRAKKLTKLEQLRRAIVTHMRQQKQVAMRWAKEQAHLPLSFPDWNSFKLGAIQMSERMTPIIQAVWEQSGTKFASRVGLDPNEWSVVNPFTEEKIRKASLAFCAETNKATSHDLDTALLKLREQLHEGIVNEGESVEQLTKRVQSIFETATQSRARTIAQTETSRAVHAAQDDAAYRSGVVTGWRWQLSSDACPVCVAIAARNPVVRLGHPFAVIGNNPIYSHVFVPPAHPRCNCTVEAILDTDHQPSFLGGPLVDPKPSTAEELQSIRQQRHDRDEAILRGSEAWGAAPYAQRYPDGRPLGQKPGAPVKVPVVKLPKVKPRRRPLAASPYEPSELPNQPMRPGEERLPGMSWSKSFEEGKHPRDESGRFRSTGAGHHFGPSTAETQIAESSNEEDEKYHLSMIFGRKSKRPTVKDLASIVGATDDAYVYVAGSHNLNTESINIITQHPKYYTDRTLARDENLRVVLHANKFDVNKSERGKGNYGPQVFGRMVEQASEWGVDYIQTTASRSEVENGYYTWARFGYDAPLSMKEKLKLPTGLSKAERVSDLMETEEGKQWWKANGSTKKMKFNLKPDSKSRKIWSAYLEEKAKLQTSPAKTWRHQILRGRRSLERTSA